jgi:hypothetical protein
MRCSPARRHTLQQLGLFHPPRKIPEWRTLPAEVRHKATMLLAQMLRQHHSKRFVFDTAKEASDE